MNMVTVWDRNSTNYNQNEFVRHNGTDSFEINSEKEALKLISHAVSKESIESLEIVLSTGRIVWTRDDWLPDSICECDSCNESQYDPEQFLQDTEELDDFDLNDPRR